MILFKFMRYILDKHDIKMENKIYRIIHKTVNTDHCVCIGGWSCEKSPFGTCAYDLDEDPACDECIYCGKPEERK